MVDKVCGLYVDEVFGGWRSWVREVHEKTLEKDPGFTKPGSLGLGYFWGVGHRLGFGHQFGVIIRRCCL